MFWHMIQEEEETVDQFVTGLKQKTLCYNYGELSDEFIQDQIIDRCRAVKLQRKLLERGLALTLRDRQEISQAHEASYFQVTKKWALKSKKKMSILLTREDDKSFKTRSN